MNNMKYWVAGSVVGALVLAVVMALGLSWGEQTERAKHVADPSKYALTCVQKFTDAGVKVNSLSDICTSIATGK